MEAQLEQLKQELEQVKTENKTLKAELDAIKAERHQERVNAALETRLKAGLFEAKDRQTEATRLKELDDGILVLLAEDAGKVAERMARATPAGPKAKYTGDDKGTFEASVESKREELFGYKRDASGKVVV